MNTTVKDVYDLIDGFAPFETQFSWDNAGLLIGSPSLPVKKIGIALDATNQVITEAVRQGCDLLVTHHPIIFEPLKSIGFDSPAANAVRNSLAVLAAHTNLDTAKEGVNSVLSEKIGLTEIQNDTLFIGKTEKTNADDFAKLINKALGTKTAYYDSGKEITKVAVCGGAAGEYLFEAIKLGADAFITGEIHHHEYLAAADSGISLFCAGHFETENPVIYLLKDKLQILPDIEVTIIRQDSPVKYS